MRNAHIVSIPKLTDPHAEDPEMKRLLVLLLITSVAGCAGVIKTRQIGATETEFNGVMFYEPTYAKMTYMFRTLTDKDGNVIGTADKECVAAIQKEEIQIMPDFARRYTITQTPGFFNSTKLGVKLDKGMISEVNVESASKLPELVTAIAPLVTPLVTRAQPGAERKASPVCNASPILADFVRMPLKG